MDVDTYRNFKGWMLDEAVGSEEWIHGLFLDTPNWLPEFNDAERLDIAERALRELVEAGLFEVVRADGVIVSPDQFDQLFESDVWRSGSDYGLFARTEYRQTSEGRDHYGKPVD